ncbi:MAG: TylF/MycF/NovP-related O-methyltransferase [Anaerolineae bacterium]
MTTRRLPQPLIAIARATRLNLLLNQLINYMPRPIQQMAVLLGARRELVPTDTLTRTYYDALKLLTLRHHPSAIGDYLEFGVYQGSSLSCMFHALQSLGYEQPRLFGFDSFEGTPEEAAQEETTRQPGEFNSSLGYTTTFLEGKGVDMSRVYLVKGWYKDTLNGAITRAYRITEASLIMIDCDLYSSTVAALEFCEPLIKTNTLIFFDDWATDDLDQRHQGERRAFEEFLQQHPYFEAEEISGLQYADTARVFRLRRLA